LSQRAAGAGRISFTAEMFASLNDQSVKFVEELVIARKTGFERGAELLVGGFGMCEVVSFEDAASVGVNDEDRVLPGVEQDGVSGFWANAAKTEKLLAKDFRGRGEEAIERAVVFNEEKISEGLESFGLLAVVAGRAEARGELRGRDLTDCLWRQEFLVTEIGDNAFDVFPGRVLSQDGANDNFETGAARPPVLAAQLFEIASGCARLCSMAQRTRQWSDNLRRRG
jgi:hypothetical protein